MIFAAGLGTRLKPLTDTRPKALVEVGGVTLLERTIATLREAGATRIVVNVHHFAAMVREFISSRDFGVAVSVSDESGHLLDTGGGIKKALPMFAPSEPILIHNVDILSNANLPRLYREGRDHDATLLVSHRETSRYLLFDDDMRLVGWTNVRTGEVRAPHESLDVDKCRRLAFSGIHVLSPALGGYMERFPDEFGIIDFYLSVCAEADIHGLEATGLRLTDVGKLDVLRQLNARWASGGLA